MNDTHQSTVNRVCVFQSYRTTNVPEWMTKCMDSVASWTGAQGFEYRFIGDEIFNVVPDWYRTAVGGKMWPMSDLARLLTSRNLLRHGFSRVIWFDADFILFNPGPLRIDLAPQFSFCHEPWLGPCDNPIKSVLRERTGISRLWSANAWKGFYTANNVNNACFCVGESWFLDSYIESVQFAGTKINEFRPMHMGPDMLAAYHKILHYPLIRNMGSFSGMVIRALATGEDRVLRAYAEHANEPIFGANLGGSENIGAGHYAAAIENLINSQGQIVNRYVNPGAAM